MVTTSDIAVKPILIFLNSSSNVSNHFGYVMCVKYMDTCDLTAEEDRESLP